MAKGREHLLIDPDAPGLNGGINIHPLPLADLIGKAEFHFAEARIAAANWRVRSNHLKKKYQDEATLYVAVKKDIPLDGHMSAFSFHERMGRLCAEIARMRIELYEAVKVKYEDGE